MNEQPIAEATLQAGLRDIRLPAEAVGGGLADIAAVVTIAGVLALIVVSLWRLASRTRSERRTGLSAAMAELPTEDTARRTALLHLLKAHAPERFANLRPTLYQANGAPDLQTLEAELRRHA
ncbi:hypothetical protein GGQ68_003823 [Sagittula marina]|uniref:Uncharacterized protein n=1 Tax=Sagittula marina TaxID=943940 RepID=A0A7W6DTJ9_9RHOB|nr:hypothetical protein [Sagittula marina]MBB3987476.1 hypothetical protein [Sagittula marina]